MIWLHFEDLLRATFSARAQQQAERPPYTGPLRRRTDPIDVDARVVDDQVLLAPHVEAEP